LADEFGMRNACGLVSDFATYLNTVILNHYQDLVPLLKGILQSNAVAINVKHHAIIAIGDIILANNGPATVPFETVMESLNAAAQMSL
jgi:hypothetical protein